MTSVDDYRHRLPALLSLQHPIALTWTHNPLIEKDLSPMPQRDTLNGTGLAIYLKCLHRDDSTRWAGLDEARGWRDSRTPVGETG